MTRCPNGLYRTMLVSIPRSGHHLLVRGITEGCDHKIVYSEYYSCVHNFNLCQYVNLQKDHDFKLHSPVDDALRYIILYRPFDQAVRSWHKSIESDDTVEDFIKSKQGYFDGFIHKWVTSDVKNRIIIQYDDLINDLETITVEACNHMGYTPNVSKIELWAKKERI